MPCRAGTITSTAQAPSSNYYDIATQGFYDQLACVTQLGYGYNGRMCPKGQYNDVYGYGECIKCPDGSTTVSEGSTSANQCVAMPGYAKVNGKFILCPEGKWVQSLEDSVVQTADFTENIVATYSPVAVALHLHYACGWQTLSNSITLLTPTVWSTE